MGWTLPVHIQFFPGRFLPLKMPVFEYGEQRFVTIGLLEDVVVIVHTETDEEIRIISMRGATKHEQKLYFKNIYDG